MQLIEKQKKQDLGIFYTPPEVVGFVFDILNIWKNKEDRETKRWQSRKPYPHYPSVIDPAVGEGVFLKGAIQSGFTKPDWIFGADIDEQAVKRWKEVNLLSDFGGKESDLKAHFFHQNGLLNIKWDQHKDKYKGKLRLDNIQSHQFDVAVGNPPYGGIGIDFKGELSKENTTLLAALEKFEIFSWKRGRNENTIDDRIASLALDSGSTSTYVPRDELARLAEGLPIEILFVERFIQLVRPGGWVVAIIPDGILSNSNSHYVRNFIADKAKVEAIISLPRETFRQAGTSAKTSVLFLRKLNENEKPLLDHPVFLATAEKISKDDFQKIVKDYVKFY